MQRGRQNLSGHQQGSVVRKSNLKSHLWLNFFGRTSENFSARLSIWDYGIIFVLFVFCVPSSLACLSYVRNSWGKHKKVQGLAHDAAKRTGIEGKPGKPGTTWCCPCASSSIPAIRTSPLRTLRTRSMVFHCFSFALRSMLKFNECFSWVDAFPRAVWHI